jgi:hypothetical protein
VVCQAWAEWIINSEPFRKNTTKTRPATAGRVFSLGRGPRQHKRSRSRIAKVGVGLSPITPTAFPSLRD